MTLRSILVGTYAIATLVASALAPVLAHDTTTLDGTLKIAEMWTRATPAGAQVAGGYLKITNLGTQPDRLIGGTLLNAATVEVHEMSMTDGVMKMQPLAQGLEIKPGETVEFKPGGFHMMFIGLKAPVKEGDKLEGTLVFQRAGAVNIHYHAAKVGAAAPAHQHP